LTKGYEIGKDVFVAFSPERVDPGNAKYHTRNTPKVIGGWDFVGDDYDSDSSDPAKTIPHPDPDPLDCNGHGSHVAGTAAGFGSLSNGEQYKGAYNASTYSNSFTIGPGGLRTRRSSVQSLGCTGSVTRDRRRRDQRAVRDGADVINMQRPVFGRTDGLTPLRPCSSAWRHRGRASAGSSGPSACVTGS
jgi:subtilisin family serine protease